LQVDRLAEFGDQLVPHGSRRGDADLLADDGAQQRLHPRRAGPRLGVAVGIEHLGEGLLALSERLEAMAEGFAGAHHQATLAA
jgi:hypothetical protein